MTSRRKVKKAIKKLRLDAPRWDEFPVMSNDPYTPEGQDPWMHAVWADGTWFRGYYKDPTLDNIMRLAADEAPRWRGLLDRLEND